MEIVPKRQWIMVVFQVKLNNLALVLETHQL